MVSADQTIVNELCKVNDRIKALLTLEEEKNKREVDIFFMNIPENGGTRTFQTGTTKIYFKTGTIKNPDDSIDSLEMNMGTRDFMHSFNIVTDNDIKIRFDSSKQHTVSGNNQETFPYINYVSVDIECITSTEISLFACTNPSTVLGSFMTVLKGQKGVVAQEATGELITVIKGDQGVVAQDASNRLISMMYGSDNSPINQDALGNLKTVIFGDTKEVAQDANGRLLADFGLIERSTLDFDIYAAGCDNRISYSSSIGMDAVKYWLNTQNQLVVLRHYDVQGTASAGTWEIDFGDGDLLAGSTGINTSLSDDKVYKKTISSSAFDYDDTDCTFKGFIIDHLKKTGDLSSLYSVVTGGASAPNAYDDDMSTYAGEYTSAGSTKVTVWEVSFASSSIDEVHIFAELKWYGGLTGIAGLDVDAYYGAAWNEVLTLTSSSSGYVYVKSHQSSLGLTGVTKLRVQIGGFAGDRSAKTQIYDISVF